MAARVAIRRLRLACLAPRDHPAPADLEGRLFDAARASLAPALEQALQDRGGQAVLRIRRLGVDITLNTAFDPERFAALLAGAIAAALRRAEDTGQGLDEAGYELGETRDVVAFPDRTAYLAALVQALAAGRATRCWWLRDAEGLRFLPPSAAIRTALLAEPADAEPALRALPPPRLAAVLLALGPPESNRVLDAIAAAAQAASGTDASVAAILAAAATSPAAESPLALYLRASATAGTGGPMLASVARLWVDLTRALDHADAGSWLAVLSGGGTHSGESATHDAPPAAQAGIHALSDAARIDVARRFASSDEALRSLAGNPAVPEAARLVLANLLALPQAALVTRLALDLAHRQTGGAASGVAREQPKFSRFAGLLLLAPGLAAEEIAACVADWPNAPPADTASLIAYAALGLCAGRERFAAWLRDPVWRELFGLDVRAAAADILERLRALAELRWHTLEPIGLKPDSAREARFLLARREIFQSAGHPGGRAPIRALAALAHGTSRRFARRLNGLRAASTPFLWENLLGTGGVFERTANGWEARLNRPPLDVLLTFSRLAEGSVQLPGGSVRMTRVTP